MNISITILQTCDFDAYNKNCEPSRPVYLTQADLMSYLVNYIKVCLVENKKSWKLYDNCSHWQIDLLKLFIFQNRKQMNKYNKNYF